MRIWIHPKRWHILPYVICRDVTWRHSNFVIFKKISSSQKWLRKTKTEYKVRFVILGTISSKFNRFGIVLVGIFRVLRVFCGLYEANEPKQILQVQVASLDAQAFRPLTERWHVDRFPTMKLVKGREGILGKIWVVFISFISMVVEGWGMGWIPI